MSSQFQKDVLKFNSMYKVPCNISPTLDIDTVVSERLSNFKNILLEEINEIDSIIKKIKILESNMLPEEEQSKLKLEILTDLADLLGDIQVYCGSEMTKFGLNIDKVLRIIMKSNFSKLDENGNPIYDERGKIQKGPGYWKPEPKISNMLKRIYKAKSNS